MKYVMACLGVLLAVTARAEAPVCLQGYRIAGTEVPDDNTILFRMRDHSVYRAHMAGRCVGLANDQRGFSYDTNPGTDEICSNLLTIRLNTTHAVCSMGVLERLGPAR